MELFRNTKFDFLAKKWPFIIASLVMVAGGMVSLVAKGGPRYGIDFKGGALMYVRFVEQPPSQEIRQALAGRIDGDIVVQDLTQTNEVLISTELGEGDERELDQARHIMIQTLEEKFGDPSEQLDFNNNGREALASRLREPLLRANVVLTEQEAEALVHRMVDYRDTPPRSGLIQNFEQLSAVEGVTPAVTSVLEQELSLSPFSVRRVEIVGPKVGADLRRQAVLAVLYALGGMLVYIAFRFEWIYGVGAVIAVFHDTLIAIGLFSITNREIDLTVVAALLTLVGYSMNDTIVIFDRIRENLKILRREPWTSLVNKSINQTLSRTVLTSGLTLLTALALFVFGGPVLNNFAFALVVGILVGTYSSVFIASPILVFWQDLLESRKVRRRRAMPVAVATGREPRRR